MPFAFTWTNVDPADPTAANLLGKDIRDLRAAIQERMDSVFCLGNSWSTSDPTHPLVVAPAILGTVAVKTISLHHSAFKVMSGTGILTLTELYAQNTHASAIAIGDNPLTLIAPVVLPQGVTISGASIMVDPRGAGSVAAALDYVTYIAPGAGVVNVTNIASGGTTGVTIATQGGLISPTNNLFAYVFKVVLNNAPGGDGNRLLAVQVYYGTPDCRSTL
jgi:hypothetical protein